MKINIKHDKRKSGLTNKGYPIVIFATQNNKKIVIRIGYYAKKTQWNDRLAQPKSNHPNYYELLDLLTLIKKNIDKVLLQSYKTSVNLKALNSLLFNKDFTVFFDLGMDYLGANNRSTMWSALQSFNKYKPNILLKEINADLAASYITELLKTNKPAGVDSYIRSLRALWNKISVEANPFVRHKIEMPEKINLVPSVKDIKKLQQADLPYNGVTGGAGRYRDYWLLMFYLGGIDPEVLAKLRYDVNVQDNRIKFNRDKGRSKTACNNIIPPAALDILKTYDCKPYLVPIFKAKNYSTFMTNYASRFKKVCMDLELSVVLRPKGPRYLFIDTAQQLLIDERITGQIVGHKRKTTTSLYTNNFPLSVQDAAHLKIIDM